MAANWFRRFGVMWSERTASLSPKKKILLTAFAAWVMIGVIVTGRKSNTPPTPESHDQLAQAKTNSWADRFRAAYAEADRESSERAARKASVQAKLDAEQAAKRETANRYGAEHKAITAAKLAVLDHLKAPSSASFPWFKTAAVHLGQGVWVVNGEVDAQNGFGAKIRNRWHVRLRWQESHDWTIEEVTIAGR